MQFHPERPGDRGAVFSVVAAAFPTPAEARLVDALRAAGAHTLSWVARGETGEVIGHALFSPAQMERDGQSLDVDILGLAPVAVHPDHQRRGVGAGLITSALDRLREAGHQAVVLLGHPTYYPRFGFRPGHTWVLACEFPSPPDAFMVMPLHKNALDDVEGGLVRYHPAFRGL